MSDLPQIVVHHTPEGSIVMINGQQIRPIELEVTHPTVRGAPVVRMVLEAELVVTTDMRWRCTYKGFNGPCNERKPHRHELQMNDEIRLVFE